jgi:hypothetical protein
MCHDCAGKGKDRLDEEKAGSVYNRQFKMCLSRHLCDLSLELRAKPIGLPNQQRAKMEFNIGIQFSHKTFRPASNEYLGGYED